MGAEIELRGIVVILIKALEHLISRHFE